MDVYSKVFVHLPFGQSVVGEICGLWCKTLAGEYCRSGNIRKVLIFANFAGGHIREFKNLAKIIIIIVLLRQNKIREF